MSSPSPGNQNPEPLCPETLVATLQHKLTYLSNSVTFLCSQRGQMRRFATFQIYDYRQHFDQAPLGVVVMDQMPSVAYCCHTKPDRVFQYPGDARILIPGNIVGDTFDQTAGYAAHALLAFASTGVQALSAVDIWSAIGTEWSPPDFDNYHYCRALLQAAADKFGMDIEWRYLLPSSFQMKKDIINGTRIVCQLLHFMGNGHDSWRSSGWLLGR